MNPVTLTRSVQQIAYHTPEYNEQCFNNGTLMILVKNQSEHPITVTVPMHGTLTIDDKYTYTVLPHAEDVTIVGPLLAYIVNNPESGVCDIIFSSVEQISVAYVQLQIPLI